MKLDREMLTKLRDAAGRLRSQGPLVALVVLCIVASIRSPGFLRPVNLQNVFRQISLTGLVAIGMTFVILSGGIDLSVGSTAAAAGVLAGMVSGGSGLAAVFVAVLLGVLVGAANGLLVTRVKIPPFIATLAMMLGARGLAFLMAGQDSKVANGSEWLSSIAKTNILGIPWLGLIFLVALGIAIVVAGHTGFGRSLYAIGGNEEAAVMMGLNVKTKKLLVYMISGGLAGAAGVLLMSRVGVAKADAAVGWELTAIAAVVIGGTSLMGGRGKMGHTLYGALILGVIANVINHEERLNYYHANLISGILLLAVVLLQSRITGGRAQTA
jgi:ribose transport system permease protein